MGTHDNRRSRKHPKSSRKITEKESVEYLSKKKKRGEKVAENLKTQTISAYSNDTNPFGDSNLNESGKRLKRLKGEERKEPLKKHSMKKWLF